MFQQIINSMPADPSGILINLMVAMGIGFGALTALLGALHSRPTMALLMLGIGSIVGLLGPQWLSVEVNRSVAICVCAIVFGLLGFLVHRYCVAFALGIIVSLVAIGILYDQTQTIDKAPTDTVQLEPSVSVTVANIWDGSTPRFRKAAPWVAGAAFVVAAITALVLPKIGMATLYSLGGTLLTLFCIKLGHTSDKIHWLDSIKTGPMTIAVLGMAMVLVGLLTQIALLYRPAPEAENAEKANT